MGLGAGCEVRAGGRQKECQARVLLVASAQHPQRQLKIDAKSKSLKEACVAALARLTGVSHYITISKDQKQCRADLAAVVDSVTRVRAS